VTVNAALAAQKDLRALRTRAARPAVQAAATAAGKVGETAAKAALNMRSHKLGTPTPSAPGQPPAKVSGDLARSILRIRTIVPRPGYAVTMWGSSLIYAHVQEYGATISAKNFPQLGNPTVGFFGPHVRIPPRPWMEFSVRKAMYSGAFARAGSAAFAKSLGI
jgi:hypothetical protein